MRHSNDMSGGKTAAGVGAGIVATLGGAAHFADDAARVAARPAIGATPIARGGANLADDAARRVPGVKWKGRTPAPLVAPVDDGASLADDAARARGTKVKSKADATDGADIIDLGADAISTDTEEDGRCAGDPTGQRCRTSEPQRRVPTRKDGRAPARRLPSDTAETSR